jgi:hypothetical protein
MSTESKKDYILPLRKLLLSIERAERYEVARYCETTLAYLYDIAARKRIPSVHLARAIMRVSILFSKHYQDESMVVTLDDF